MYSAVICSTLTEDIVAFSGEWALRINALCLFVPVSQYPFVLVSLYLSVSLRLSVPLSYCSFILRQCVSYVPVTPWIVSLRCSFASLSLCLSVPVSKWLYVSVPVFQRQPWVFVLCLNVPCVSVFLCLSIYLFHKFLNVCLSMYLVCLGI